MTEQELKKKKTEEKERKEEAKPPTEEDVRQELIREFEKRDEEQIEKEILGDIVSNYCYAYTPKGSSREVKNLSLAGIKEIARQMGNIRSDEPKIEEFATKYRVITKVIDGVKKLEFWGVSEQNKKMRLSGGGERDDDFALQKACSKSLRNGLVSLIPQHMKVKMIEKFDKERAQRAKDAKSFG